MAGSVAARLAMEDELWLDAFGGACAVDSNRAPLRKEKIARALLLRAGA